MKYLILWDIDGTLIHGGGVAGEALRAAMTRTLGPIEGPPISYAGKTDQQILLETYPHYDETHLPSLLERYVPQYMEELERRREEYRQRGAVLPGVRDLLARFHADPSILQSLLTGNIMPAARVKLTMFGLDPYVDFEVGAYGSDHHQRTALVPFALRRAAERYGREFVGAEVIVIGDTPNDIACGKAVSARTIGVATGSYTVEQLQAAGADAVLPNLGETDTAAQTILAGA